MRRGRRIRSTASDMLYGARTLLADLSVPDRSVPEPPEGLTKRPVVLLPGVFETWYFLQPLARALVANGHPVFAVPELRHNSDSIVTSAETVAVSLDARGLSDVAVVAHSKGGLIAKQLMVSRPELIAYAVTICTPFSGSRYARLAPVPSLRAFATRDTTTLALAENLDANSRITSIFGSFDPLIPEGSELEGARNVRLEASGHFALLSTTELADAVTHALDEHERHVTTRP